MTGLHFWFAKRAPSCATMWQWRVILILVSLTALAPSVRAEQYVAMGDSLTFGSGSSGGSARFTEILQARLNAAGGSYTLTNYGVSGARAPQVRSEQLAATLTSNPDLVTLTVGANDARAITTGTQTVPQFTEAVEFIVSSLRADAAQRRILVATVPDLSRLPAASDNPFTLQEGDGYAPTPGEKANLTSLVKQLNGVLINVAAGHGASVVDTFGESRTYDPANISTDGFHPDNSGHALLAERFDVARGLLVTSTGDLSSSSDNRTTLREAIATASGVSGAPIVTFANDVRGTLTLTQGEISFGSSASSVLTVAGPSASTLSVSGNGTNRIFRFANGLVSLQNLALRNGRARGQDNAPRGPDALGNGMGGAINNGAGLSLTDVTLENNSAVGGNHNFGSGGDGMGGAIYNTGTLSLARCRVAGNVAASGGDEDLPSGGCFGGAIMNSLSGFARFTDCTFVDNSALTASFFGSGGAIFSQGALTLTNCTLNRNKTRNTGGALETQTGNATITGSTFEANEAIYGAGAISGRSGVIQITGSTFTNNSAISGGALVMETPFSLERSVFNGNRAVRRSQSPSTSALAGALYASKNGTVSNCTFSGNSSADGGAAVVSDGYAGNVRLTIAHSTLVGNSATSGGGLYSTTNGGFNLSHCLLAFNTGGDIVAVFTSQGFNFIRAYVPSQANAGPIGSDRWGTTSAPLDPSLQMLSAQTPLLQNNGGTVLTVALLPGSRAVNAGDASIAPSASTFDARGSGFARVAANRIDIGAFELQSANFRESLLVTTLADEDNGTSDASYGSGTSLREAIAFANSNRNGNTVDTIAFAVNVRGNMVLNQSLSITTPITIEGPGAKNLTITRSIAAGADQFRLLNIGHVSDSIAVEIAGLRFTNGDANELNNEGGNDGGALQIVYGELTLTDCVFSDNTASSGGALNALSARVWLNRCTLNGNRATARGGAIKVTESANAVLSHCTVSGNSCLYESGAIENSGVVHLSFCTISGNTAEGNSGVGGISNDAFASTTLTVYNSVVAGNGPNLDIANNGRFLSVNFNLLGRVQGAFSPAANDLLDVTTGQTQLGPLQDNGGAIPTHGLLPGSLAIDRGDAAFSSADFPHDARGNGFPRSKRARVDIGAFEVQNERPAVADFSKSTGEDNPLVFSDSDFAAAFTDSDDAALAQIKIVSLPLISAGVLKQGENAIVLNQTLAVSALNELRFVPATDFSGATSFVYNAADRFGFAAQAATITLQVLADNDAPTISAFASQRAVEDTPTQAIAFAVRDAETPADELVVSATATDASVVGAEGFTLGGSDGDRFLIITPKPNASGTTTITVKVGDGTLSTSVAFELEIAPQNDAPTAISETVTLGEDANANLTLRGSDLEADALTFTVVTPPAHGTLSGTAPNLTFRPAANFNGSDQFTFKASDGDKESEAATVSLQVLAANDAPTLDAIADVTVNEDAGLQTIELTGISAGPNESQTLSVSARTDNIDVVPGVRIVYSSPNNTASLTFNSPTDASGSANITVTVSDGVATFERRFTITVRAQNDAPTISIVADVSTREDTPTRPIVFSVGDAETAAEDLTLSATSSNTALVPNNGIALGGTQRGRSLIITPAPDASGATQITIMVSDGALHSVARFTLQVLADDDAPTLSLLVNQQIGEDGGASSQNFSVTDVDTPLDNLVFTATSSDSFLVPQANISLNGGGQNRTIAVTPAIGRSGDATITLSVSDGTSRRTASFELQVLAQNDAPRAVGDAYAVAGVEPLTVPAPGVLANDSDEDGPLMHPVLLTFPAHGQLQLQPDGGFRYTPEVGFHGRDEFSYRTSDGYASSDAVTVALQVSNNPLPTLSLALTRNSVREGESLTATLRLSRPVAADTFFSLSAKNSASPLGPVAVSLPGALQVLAGKSTASFSVQTRRDAIATGTQTIVIGANNQLGVAQATLLIADLDTPTLTLSVTPGNFNEADGPQAATLTITRNTPLDRPLRVSLFSDSRSVRVPGDILLAVEFRSVSLRLVAYDNRVVNPSAIVTLRGRAAGLPEATTKVRVWDNGRVTRDLQLFLENHGALIERAGGYTATGSVSISGVPLTRPLSITLVSNRPDRLSVPRSVVLPAGRNRVSFSLRVSDNNLLEGPQHVFVTAKSFGLGTSFVGVIIADDEGPTLLLQLPRASVSENAGSIVATLIRRNTNNSRALGVSLSSSDRALITPPATVFIPAGRDRVSFTVRIQDDRAIQATRQVTLLATHSGLTSGTARLDVLNDDRATATNPTPLPTPTIRSPVALSSATATTFNHWQLRFTGALDPNSALDATRYRVTIDGHVVEIESLAYASNVVTVTLPADTPIHGNVVIAWQDMRDAQGRVLSGKTGELKVR